MAVAADGSGDYLGLVGCGILPAVAAVAFAVVSSKWTENTRAKFDMDRTWCQRRNYRLPPGHVSDR